MIKRGAIIGIGTVLLVAGLAGVGLLHTGLIFPPLSNGPAKDLLPAVQESVAPPSEVDETVTGGAGASAPALQPGAQTGAGAGRPAGQLPNQPGKPSNQVVKPPGQNGKPPSRTGTPPRPDR